VLAPALMLAAIAGIMWAFGWTPKAKHYVDPLLERAFHPMTQTPAPVPAASQPDQPVYREWLPQAGGWVLANAQCEPLRGSFIADPAPRAQPAVLRAELVSMPVRRATLVGN
jgi:hypothetical protein